jgi:hypothetical protein
MEPRDNLSSATSFMFFEDIYLMIPNSISEIEKTAQKILVIWILGLISSIIGRGGSAIVALTPSKSWTHATAFVKRYIQWL